jgi:RHS repeat-associated protein
MWTREGLGRSFIYGYNADGERVAIRDLQDDSFRFTLRDLDHKVIREFIYENGEYRWDQDWVHADSKVIASVDGDGTRHYHVDHLGTPRLVSDTSVINLGVNSYSPFGSLIAGDGKHRLQFTGHERDPGGLDYLHARNLSVLGARLLSVDPVAAEIWSSQGWNRFCYVRNNPLILVDPTGQVIEFANKESEDAFWAYWDTLDVESEDYHNLMQLEDSEIRYLVGVVGTDGNAEGGISFNGQEVLVNVDPVRPDEDASSQSRFAHEFQHAVQVDNGDLGFRYSDGDWGVIFVDIHDEIDAFKAQLRQALPTDFHSGTLRGFAVSEDSKRADYLINHGYGHFAGMDQSKLAAPTIPGYKPGQLLNTGNLFFRIPK